MVGHKERVEAPVFEGLSETLQVLKVEIRVGIGAGIASPTRLDAHGAHERAEASCRSAIGTSSVLIGERPPSRGTANACPEARALDNGT
jgi:hypothetical protein